MKIQKFIDQCNDILGDTIHLLGFHQERAMSLPRGLVIEYKRADLSILLTYENPELVVDVIMPLSSEKWIRISVNQLFWYQKNYEFKNAIILDEKIKIISEKIGYLLDFILIQDIQDFDKRYCYQMNKSELEIFRKANFEN